MGLKEGDRLNSEIITELNPLEVEIWRRAIGYQDKRLDVGHAAMVTGWAIKLLEFEKADRKVVVPAAILHDIGWSQVLEAERLATNRRQLGKEDERRVRMEHQARGVILAAHILQNLIYKEELIPTILEIISGHDTRNGCLSIEEAVMRDADKLFRFTRLAIEYDIRNRGGIDISQCLQELEGKIDNEGYFFTETAKRFAREEIKNRKLEAATSSS